MKKPIIKRYFSDDILPIINKDFKFLIGMIKRSGFEYDLQIRDGYFNLYYRGNNLGKVEYVKTKELYNVYIHHKFVDQQIVREFKGHRNSSNPDTKFLVTRSKMYRFFRRENLRKMGQRVKKVNYQEERTLEQVLMTDNVNRSDLIIIDRQVVDTVDQTKMDMLALVRQKKNDYRFSILEVKLGNNPELREKVGQQLTEYVKKVRRYFNDYKKCYQKNLEQKQRLGLIDDKLKVNIAKGVSGVVVVVGYSGIALDSIKKLKKKAPDIKVVQLKNRIDLSKAK